MTRNVVPSQCPADEQPGADTTYLGAINRILPLFPVSYRRELYLRLWQRLPQVLPPVTEVLDLDAITSLLHP